jgi:NADPH:quinone reductase-like Zn-dependent oxidoreductase
MKAWQIHQYGGNENLMLSSLVRIPKVQDPTDILVQVHAASINPITARSESARRFDNRKEKSREILHWLINKGIIT